MQPRKNDGAQERKASKSTKYRDVKQKIYPIRKQLFLTDTQTSDYTKSSGQMQIMRIQKLELLVKQLKKQNQQQKMTIINMKANQFFQLNEQKVKDLIKENQYLRNQLVQMKKQVQQLLIQRDFLKRFNKNLKAECSTLTKQLLTLKTPYSSIQHRAEKSLSINNESSQDIHKNFTRSISAQTFLITKKKQKEKEQERQKQKRQPKINLNSNRPNNFQSILNYEYFHGSINLESKKQFKQTMS